MNYSYVTLYCIYMSFYSLKLHYQAWTVSYSSINLTTSTIFPQHCKSLPQGLFIEIHIAVSQAFFPILGTQPSIFINCRVGNGSPTLTRDPCDPPSTWCRTHLIHDPTFYYSWTKDLWATKSLVPLLDQFCDQSWPTLNTRDQLTCFQLLHPLPKDAIILHSSNPIIPLFTKNS